MAKIVLKYNSTWNAANVDTQLDTPWSSRWGWLFRRKLPIATVSGDEQTPNPAAPRHLRSTSINLFILKAVNSREKCKFLFTTVHCVPSLKTQSASSRSYMLQIREGKKWLRLKLRTLKYTLCKELINQSGELRLSKLIFFVPEHSRKWACRRICDTQREILYLITIRKTYLVSKIVGVCTNSIN